MQRLKKQVFLIHFNFKITKYTSSSLFSSSLSQPVFSSVDDDGANVIMKSSAFFEILFLFLRLLPD